MNSKKILLIAIVALIVFEILISGYLAYESTKPSDSKMCIIGQSCESVQDSNYGKILGIKLPFYGLIAFSLLLVLFFGNKKLFHAGVYAGSLSSVYLISVQLFILKQVCSTCMLIDITMFTILILTFFYFKAPKTI